METLETPEVYTTQPTLHHSLPAWMGGPRFYNAKFAIPGCGGEEQVVNRVLFVQRLWGELTASKQVNGQIFTSYHIGHEVRATDPYVDARVRSPWAITLDLMKGLIADGRIPKVNAFTFPCFGYAGTEEGGILHPDPEVRELAYRGHTEAILRSLELQQAGLGNGLAIWWPAGDGLKPVGIPQETRWTTESIMGSKEWEQFLRFWIKVLGNTGGTIHCEFKMGDPQIDYICTPYLAYAFCDALNTELGRPAAFQNWEFAHVLGTGEDVAPTMEETIKRGQFRTMFHGNSGIKLGYTFASLLERPVHPLKLATVADLDLPMGEGDPDVVEDQRQAMQVIKRYARQTGEMVVCEHDLHNFDYPWSVCMAHSICAAQQMWEN